MLCVDEPCEHAKSKKPETKGHTVYVFMCVKYPEKADLYRQRVDPGATTGGRERAGCGGTWFGMTTVFHGIQCGCLHTFRMD